MTDRDGPGEHTTPFQVDGPAIGPEGPQGPPGASTFTLEGRAAPGLFFLGWIATIMGLGIVLVGGLSGGGPTAVVLTLLGAALAALGLVAGAGSQALERRARGRPYGGPSPFLVFGASLPLTLLLVVLVVDVPAWILGFDPASPLGAFASVVVTALVYVGLVRLLVVGPGALSWAEMGVRRFDLRAVSDLAAGAAVAVPVVVLTGIVAIVLVKIVGSSPESPLPQSTSTAGLLLNLVTAAIVAPAGEEVFYRGFSTTAWARGIGLRGALVRGALFFAFVHVLTVGGATFGDAAGSALVAFAARIPVALALGWIFLRRGSIWASIGLHGTFNGLLIVLAELATRAGGG